MLIISRLLNNNLDNALYNVVSHASQPIIFADIGNNFVSILAVFGDLSEFLKSHVVTNKLYNRLLRLL